MLDFIKINLTTGRGTPFATLVPTMKISSNTKIAEHKKNWIDFNAGRMVEDMTKSRRHCSTT